MKGKLIKATVNLFCFPFAGGNRYSYQKYLQHAPPYLRIIPIEYPGRGSRAMEPLASRMDLLVDDLYNHVRKNIDQCEYAIYGHSMGGLVGYLVARKLIANDHRPPQHLFITGAPAPSSTFQSTVKRHSLPDAEFMEELKKLDGVSDELLLNKDLFSYVGPILRADFKICEDFQYVNTSPLQLPVTVITGTKEEIEMGDIRLWQKETEYTVDFIQLPGKHFFIFREPGEIIDIISQKLRANSNVYQL